MQQTYKVRRNEHSTTRGFDEVVRIFEGALGSVEDGALKDIVASTRTAEEFEERLRSREASSGFMRFPTVDHGARDVPLRIGRARSDVHDWEPPHCADNA